MKLEKKPKLDTVVILDIDTELKEELRKYAKMSGRSMASFVRELISNYAKSK